MSELKVRVDQDALLRVLAALNGPEHHIREMLATREVDQNNPINELIDSIEVDDNRVILMVDKQAEDEGLWFEAQTAPEAYLQMKLRELHAVIEG